MTVQNNHSVIRVLWCLLLLSSVLFAISAAAFAVTDKIIIEDDITEDRYIEESITLYQVNQSVMNIRLPALAYDITVDGKNGSSINNSIEIAACNLCTTKIMYKIHAGVRSMGNERFEYVRTLDFPQIPQVLEYRIKMPIGYIIKENEYPIAPKPTEITTDGVHTSIVWKSTLPQLPQVYSLNFFNHEGTETFSQEVVNELSEVYVIIGLIIVLLIGLVLGALFARRFAPKRKIMHIPGSLLSPDEKHIIQEIRTQGDKTSQKILAAKLNWSKSKVSAVLSGLEYKKMITREKIGRNYTVTLVRDYEE